MDAKNQLWHNTGFTKHLPNHVGPDRLAVGTPLIVCFCVGASVRTSVGAKGKGGASKAMPLAMDQKLWLFGTPLFPDIG